MDKYDDPQRASDSVGSQVDADDDGYNTHSDAASIPRTPSPVSNAGSDGQVNTLTTPVPHGCIQIQLPPSDSEERFLTARWIKVQVKTHI